MEFLFCQVICVSPDTGYGSRCGRLAKGVFTPFRATTSEVHSLGPYLVYYPVLNKVYTVCFTGTRYGTRSTRVCCYAAAAAAATAVIIR